MKPQYSTVIPVMTLLLAGCQIGDSAKVDSSAEIQVVRDADRALLQAENDRDMEAAMLHIGEGAVFQPPDSPPVVGTAAIRTFYTESFRTPIRGVYRDSDTVFVSSSGDMACLAGNSHLELDAPNGVVSIPGKYLTIWRKIDDHWLCIAASWSGNQKPQ